MPDSDSYTEVCKSVREIVMNMVMSLAWRHSTLEKILGGGALCWLEIQQRGKTSITNANLLRHTTQEQNFLSEQTALPSPHQHLRSSWQYDRHRARFLRL